MEKPYKNIISAFLTMSFMAIISGCSGKGGKGDLHVAGNESGSKPINKTELAEYKRAILKCYKTGGSRIVKVKGKLMCY